ncbi:hypothetical protein B0J18DRAFT_439633 [Chaetomium sp. MPI-SDFR-AT-0129]|nr:hypothetical protein B0J18DRAFT_439633 [Chaetomium sp. MPI-SDFR-AT-0129]
MRRSVTSILHLIPVVTFLVPPAARNRGHRAASYARQSRPCAISLLRRDRPLSRRGYVMLSPPRHLPSSANIVTFP